MPASPTAPLGEMNKAIDVRRVLDSISAPTLVLHQHADPWVQVEHGRYLAEHIPGAVYAELYGKEHIPTGAFAPQLLAHIIPFLQEATARKAANRTRCWQRSSSPI
jgi:pimeloyl-ACP methyl ester carboxylesterase